MVVRNDVRPTDPGFLSQQSLGFQQGLLNADPSMPSRLAQIHYSFPDLHPEVKVALAQSGLDATHPAVVQAVDAQRTLNAKQKSSGGIGGLFGRAIGDVGGFVSGAEHAAGHLITAGARGAFTGLAAIPEEGMGALRSIAGDIGGAAGGFAAGAVGGAAAGAMAGGASGGIIGSIAPGIGNLIGAVSGATGGILGGALIGGVAGAIGGSHIKGEGGFHIQSAAGLAAKHLLAGQKVDLGHGFFPAGSIASQTMDAQGNPIDSEQTRIQRQVASIDGHALTPGRVIASSVFEPGSTPYKTLSGMMDFATQWEEVKVDPAFQGLERLGKINGARKTINADVVQDFMKSEAGVKLRDGLVAETSPWKIYEQSGKQFSLADSKAIAEAKDVGTVDKILNRSLGTEVTTKFKLEAQQNPVSRLLLSDGVQRAMAPVRTDANKLGRPGAVLEQWDALQRIAKVPEETRVANNERMMNGLIDLEGSGKAPPASEFTPTSWRTDPPKASVGGQVARTQAMEWSKQADTLEASLNDEKTVAAGADQLKITPEEFKTRMRQLVDKTRGQAADTMKQAVLADGKMIQPGQQLQPMLQGMPAFDTGMKAGQTSVSSMPPTLDWAGSEVNAASPAGASALKYDPAAVTREMAAKQGIELGGHAPAEPVGNLRALGQDVTGEKVAAQQRALNVAEKQVFPAFQGILDSMASVLEAHGVDADKAREMTRVWKDETLQSRMHISDSIANNEPLPGVINAGKTIGIPNESALAEMLRSGVQPPDIKDIRRELAVWQPVLRRLHLDPAAKGATQVMDFVMSRVWKPLQILRAALPIRVLAEEHARMAASGMDSIFTHPFSMVAMAHALDEGTALTATGEPMRLADAAAEAISNGAKDAFDVGNTKVKYKTKLKPSAGPDFINGWRDSSLVDSRTNQLHQIIAKDGTEAGIKFLTGNNPDGVATLKQLRGLKADDSYLRTYDQISTYVQQEASHVEDITRQDPTLLKYVSDGPQSAAVDLSARQEITQKLKDLWGAGNTPAEVVKDKDLANPKIYDRATDFFFNKIMQEPSTKYARLPWFSQAYWSRMEELMPTLTEEAKTAVLENAKKSEGMPTGSVQRLEAAAKTPMPAQFEGVGLDHVHADKMAQGAALQSVKDTLYDLGKKSNWADATRLVFPFAEPWQQSLKHWSTIMMDHPQDIRRVQQGVEGARGAGFFYKNPETGEEMFAYPGSEFITKHVVGAPIKLAGGVKSLNMFAENPTMPGLGPIAQIAAEKLMANKPEFDWIMNTIDPRYGTDKRSTLEKFVAPAAWMDKAQRIFSSPNSDRDFGNTTYEMARYLVSTGDYNLNSQDAIDRTNQAAVGMARRMYTLRALASFSLPAAPQLEYKGQGKPMDGSAQAHLYTQVALTAEFKKLQDADYNSATQKFLEKFGEGALLYMQPKSKGGPPPVDDMAKWTQKNEQVVRQYPDVYSYFGPHAGAFSSSYYDKQIALGQRQALKPEEAEKLANHRVAEMVWRTAKDKVGSNPTQAQQDWLDTTKATLLKQYPGFEPTPRDIAKVPRMVEQISSAMNDPRLTSTPAGQAAKIYLVARDKAIEAAKASGDKTFMTAKGQAGTRDWLRKIGAALVQAQPEFGDMWDQVFSREMKQDETPAVLQGAPA